ncbi:MAG: alpha/beta hydrolase [Pseudomonadota bacterium]
MGKKATDEVGPEPIRFTQRSIRARDGIPLSARIHSSAPLGQRGAVFVCLPSIDRTAREFDQFARVACSSHSATIIALDARGRGASGSGAYGYSKDADDLIDALTALGIEHAFFVASGYGGLVCLSLATNRPGAMRSLTLLDGGPALDATGLARLQYRLRREASYENRDQAIERLMAYDRKHFPKAESSDFAAMVGASYAQSTTQKAERWVPDLQPDFLKRLSNLDLSEAMSARWDLFAGLAHVPMLIMQPSNSTMVDKQAFQAMLTARKTVSSPTRHISLTDQGSTPILSGKLAKAVMDFHLTA